MSLSFTRQQTFLQLSPERLSKARGVSSQTVQSSLMASNQTPYGELSVLQDTALGHFQTLPLGDSSELTCVLHIVGQ